MSVCLPACLPVCLFVCLSVLFVCFFVLACLSVCVCICVRGSRNANAQQACPVEPGRENAVLMRHQWCETGAVAFQAIGLAAGVTKSELEPAFEPQI